MYGSAFPRWAFFFYNNSLHLIMTLDEIAVIAQTDKASTGHNYAAVYETYLEKLRYYPLLIFDIGIGGYQYADRGGQSLKMWYNYFPKAKIIGIDIYQKDGLENDRVVVAKGSQTDADFLFGLVEKYGEPDLIIDDASHICHHTIATFQILFHRLKRGGLYFCEDVHTSFWPDYGGDPDPEVQGTTLEYFQKLTAQLSHDTLLPEFHGQFAGYLQFIHFYRNLVIIKKVS